MTWSDKRKLMYAVTVFLILVLFGGLWYIFFGYEAPSCIDKKQNQSEEGVDCGGPCSIICTAQVTPPLVLWQRVFPLGGGLSNAVAYIENSNTNLGVQEAIYSFRLYDDKNIIVAERKGRTFIGPNSRFAIIEPRISTGERVPTRAFFEFLSFSNWERTDNLRPPPMFVRDEKLTNESTLTRLDATLKNGTIVDIDNIDAVAILYDKNENAVAVSSTKVDTLPKEGSVNLVFTWPKIITDDIGRIEVIPRVDPFLFTI